MKKVILSSLIFCLTFLTFAQRGSYSEGSKKTKKEKKKKKNEYEKKYSIIENKGTLREEGKRIEFSTKKTSSHEVVVEVERR